MISGLQRSLLSVAVILSLLAIVISAVSYAQTSNRPSTSGLQAPPATTRKFVLTSDIINGSNRFSTSTIVVYQGDTVNMTITDKALVPHSFAIDEYNVKVNLPIGQPVVVTFVADKPGVFRFYCFLHPAHIGGELVVLPRPSS